MASYIVRRSKPNVFEDCTDELKTSHLFLIKDTKTPKEGRVFVLKWNIDRPVHLLSGVIYAAHYVRLGKSIHRLRVARFESNHQRRTYYIVGLTPHWGVNNKVSFSIVEEDFEIKPEPAPSSSNQLNVPDRKCFFKFAEYISLRHTLVVLVTIECGDSTVDIDLNKHSDLVPDMLNLMDSADLSDVTMVVGGEEFRLHKAILSARSPVFRAMFRTDMRETGSGRVVVEGEPDGRTFRQFIRYMYAGKTESLDPELALGLLEWADKYQVEDLRQEVVEFLTHNLSRESILRVFVAADAVVANDLKVAACGYIAEHLNVLMRSSDWSCVRHRADLLEDILRHFVY